MKKTTRLDAIAVIERFLADAGQPHDWDDFTSLKIEHDPFLESVRLRCFHLRDAYPPNAGDYSYCNEEGMAVLVSILDDLKSKR